MAVVVAELVAEEVPVVCCKAQVTQYHQDNFTQFRLVVVVQVVRLVLVVME